MNSSATYEEQWKSYQRRSRLFWLVFLTYVPGVFAIGVPLTRLFSSEIPVFVAAGLCMLAFVVSGNYAIEDRGITTRLPDDAFTASCRSGQSIPEPRNDALVSNTPKA